MASTSSAHDTFRAVEAEIDSVRARWELEAFGPASNGEGTLYARRAYEESMQQLIHRLDGVSTQGRDDIRQSRKNLVCRIQGLVNQLDAFVTRDRELESIRSRNAVLDRGV
eukprot:Sspe_Gene.56406::Locus_31029_Transcript_2_2_Confidence_0.667_Length_929::g.56406::m.56406